MKKILPYTIAVVILSINLKIPAQSKIIDSLLVALKTIKEDTIKVNHLNKLSIEYFFNSNYDTAMYYARMAQSLAEQLGFKKGIAVSYYNSGCVHDDQGNYTLALECYLKALKLYDEFNDKAWQARLFGNIGILYYNLQDYSKALEYNFKALEIGNVMKDKRRISILLGNIGLVYADQGQFSKALEYYFESLKMKEELSNKNGIAITLGNIGSVYGYLGEQSIDTHYRENMYNKSLEYHLKALKIAEEIGNENGIAIKLSNIGSNYIKSKKYREASDYLYRALNISHKINTIDVQKGIYEMLSVLYEVSDIPLRDSTNGKLLNMEGMRLRALHYYRNYIFLKDTLFSEENKKELVRKQMTYDFEKKEAATKAEHDKEIVIMEADKKNQQIITWSVVSGLMLVLIFSGFVLRSLHLTRKQKDIIEQQKSLVEKKNNLIEEQNILVEHKNKEITDSIEYARHIQYALLTSDSYLHKHLEKEFFILFKPKDIVSGDFYWATKRDNKFYFAVCDSTGHGVPGAFMSLLNISFLSEAITEKQIDQPGEIFNYVRKRLVHSISRDGARDGMDGILVCFDKENHTISYAAANNAPVISSANHIIELSLDKMPVGKGEKTDSFTTYTIQFKQGDMLYLCTDGYPDQFGGPKGKKFKYRQLEALLSANSHLGMEEQRNILMKTFEDWKGSLEQVDDVTVVGIRV